MPPIRLTFTVAGVTIHADVTIDLPAPAAAAPAVPPM
jgi:hypothetical protein